MSAIRRNRLTPYELLGASTRLPTSARWCVVAGLVWLAAEYLVIRFAETFYPIVQLLGVVGIALMPIGYMSFASRFRSTMLSLSGTFWTTEAECRQWVAQQVELIFTFRSGLARAVTLGIAAAAVATVVLLKIPHNSIQFYLGALTGFALLALICGHGGYICIRLLTSLSVLSQRTPRIPFNLLSHEAFGALQTLYAYVALFITIGYIILTVAVWKSFWGFDSLLLTWLSALALLPLSLMFWSTYLIHRMIKRAKHDHLLRISERADLVANQVAAGGDAASLEELLKLMEIQQRIASQREWTVNLPGGITYILALVTAFVQIMLSLNEVSK